MVKKFYDKSPVLAGMLYGLGLFLIFILLEYLTSPGVILDSIFRIIFGVIAIILLKNIYQDELNTKFTAPISVKTWLLCIPFFILYGIEFLYLTISESLTTAYLSGFLLVCVQQLTTGFFEEAASRGIVMSGMFSKWKFTVHGRIFMVIITGVLFAVMHMFNVLFGDDFNLSGYIANGVFGMFLAAIYLYSENLMLCMILHAGSDIIVRIPEYFCVNIQSGNVLDFINTSQTIFNLAVLPIVAILICFIYRPKSKNMVE